MAGTLEESALAGVGQVYIVQEPDAAGATFVKALAERLERWQWQGRAAGVHLPGTIDPNELYKQDRNGFRAAFQYALDHAERLVFHHPHPVPPLTCTKPNVLRLP